MAIQLKSTRVRPNTGVQWVSIAPDEDPANIYYNTTYVQTEKVTEISFSETDLQRVIVRQFNNVEDKNAYLAEFSNTSSPLYARTQYNTANGITLTHEVI
jgi:hypothetical protein